MEIPDHLTSPLRSIYAGQEITVRTGRETTDLFQIGKVPGASTGVSTHDKVMWESFVDKASQNSRGAPLGLSEHLPQNQNLFYYFTTFTNSFDINRWLFPNTFFCKKINLKL